MYDRKRCTFDACYFPSNGPYFKASTHYYASTLIRRNLTKLNVTKFGQPTGKRGIVHMRCQLEVSDGNMACHFADMMPVEILSEWWQARSKGVMEDRGAPWNSSLPRRLKINIPLMHLGISRPPPHKKIFRPIPAKALPLRYLQVVWLRAWMVEQ